MEKICTHCNKKYEWDGNKYNKDSGFGKSYKADIFCCGLCAKRASISKRQKTNIKKFGTKTPAESEAIQHKMKQTCLKKYGVANVYAATEIKNKIKEKNNELYGVEYSAQRSDVKKKIKKTILKNYGVEHHLQNKQILEKQQKTIRKKYGVDFLTQSTDIKEKIKNKIISTYGVEYILQVPEIRSKIEQTCLKKYGNKSFLGSDINKQILKDNQKDIIQKKYKTMKMNNSFKRSKWEDIAYKKLQTKFNKVERQYKSEQYPWNCDFYIPELELYIECNFHWTHGKKPYNSSENECVFLVEKWKMKNTKYYNNAIKTWTILDTAKRKVGASINWIEFFSKKELEDFINDN